MSNEYEPGESRDLGERQAVPLEIQKAFSEWLENQEYAKGCEIISYPNKLFWSIREPKQKGVVRLYHTWNPSLPPEEQTFPRMAQSELEKSVTDEDHTYQPYALHFFDESGEEKSEPRKKVPINGITVRFNNMGRTIILLGTNIWLTSDNRTLFIEDVENISEIRFTEVDQTQDIFERYLFDEIGKTAYSHTGTVDEDEKAVRIKHFGNGVIDDIVVKKGNTDETISKSLFDDYLLDEPFLAPPYYDDLWLTADIEGVLGVRWEIKPIQQEAPIEDLRVPIRALNREVIEKANPKGLFKRIRSKFLKH